MDWYWLIAVGAFVFFWFKLKEMEIKLDAIKTQLTILSDKIR